MTRLPSRAARALSLAAIAISAAGCHLLLSHSPAASDRSGAEGPRAEGPRADLSSLDRLVADRAPADRPGGDRPPADLPRLDSPPPPPWLKTAGGASTGEQADAYAVAVDGAGNSYIAGTFSGAINLGGNTITSIGSNDVFVASFSAAGAHRWSRGIGSPLTDEARALVLDSKGTVWVAGRFAGSAAFDAAGKGVLSADGANKPDGFLAGYDGATGGYLTAVRFGGSEDDEALGLALDASDNLYLTGDFAGTATIAGNSLSSTGGSDLFVASYATGAPPTARWARRLGGASHEKGYAIAADATSVCTAGLYQSASFSPPPTQPLAPAAASDILVVCHSPVGDLFWVAGFGSATSDGGLATALDSASVQVGGFVNSAITLGGASSTNVGRAPIRLSLDRTTGSLQSAQVYVPTGGTSAVLAMAVDAAGKDLYLAGRIDGNANLGMSELAGIGAGDLFVAEYTTGPSPAFVASRRFGGSIASASWANAVALEPGGKAVLLAGGVATGSTLTAAGTTLPKAPGQRMLLLRLPLPL